MVVLRNKKATSTDKGGEGKTTERHLVTGGGGYAGFWLGKHLAAQGHKCDITDGAILNGLFDGVDCVYHLASYGMSGREQLNKAKIEAVNVDGTENVINACLQNNVTRLVYTSTYNVVFSGQTIVDGDESLPYLPLHQDYIERGLFCVVYGGKSVTDFLHVENLAQAHQLAGEGLTKGRAHIAAGQCYSINDEAPINAIAFFKPLVEGLGYTMPSIRLPVKLVYFIAVLIEWLHYLLSWIYNFQPLLTRAEVNKTGVTHFFTTKKARQELGYESTIKNDLSAVVQHYVQTGHKKVATKPGSKIVRYIVDGIFVVIFAVLIVSALPLVK